MLILLLIQQFLTIHIFCSGSMLYKKVSDYVTLQGRKIGKGLFSHAPISEGCVIGFYTGTDVSKEEYRRRCNANLGGYGIRMSKTITKDCRIHFCKGHCLVSAANSAFNLKSAITGELVKDNNARLIVFKGSAYLKATRDIKANEEILISYSSSYWH